MPERAQSACEPKTLASQHGIAIVQAMANNPHPFDRHLLRARRNRASRTLTEADFLLQRATDEFADRLRATNRQFETVLNLGAHSGDMSRTLAPHFADMPISMDLSPRMVADAPAPRLAGDEEALPFAPESLDLVLSALSLHWVNDLPGSLLQVRKALKPDGLFMGALFGGSTLHELRDVMMQAETEVCGGVSPRIAPFADVKDMGHLMQRAGFALPVTDADVVTVRYDTAFHLFKDLKAMGETSILNDRRRTPTTFALLRRAAEIYQDRFADENGRLPATFEIIYMTGWAPHESQQKPMRPGTAKLSLAEALKNQESGNDE